MSPTIQPGIKIRHVEGQPGTLGAFALHSSGRICLIGAEHTITNHWRARLGDPIMLDSTGSTPDLSVSLRIKEVAEDSPAVLKPPGELIKDMTVIKYGWQTKKTSGKILEVNSSVNVKYKDGSIRRLENLIAAEIEADHGDSGSILLSAEKYKPLGWRYLSTRRLRRPSYLD